jgi:hypothetical protein
MWFRLLVVAVAVGLLGCSASTRSSAVPAPPGPAVRGFDSIQRVAVVAYGDSRFTAISQSAEPGRTFDEMSRWGIFGEYGPMLRPLLGLLHQGINWLLNLDEAKAVSAHVGAVSPRSLVAEALVNSLEASGRFEQVRAMEREPVGEDRRRADAIVRITVPSWGFVRVRQGDPPLVSVFADVQGQVTLRGTGVVVWEGKEDVTGPERLPLESLTRDQDFARQQLTEVLAQAGHRLASEILYSRSAGP